MLWLVEVLRGAMLRGEILRGDEVHEVGDVQVGVCNGWPVGGWRWSGSCHYGVNIDVRRTILVE